MAEPKIFVVGDSIAVGIGQALGSDAHMVKAQGGAPVASMGIRFFEPVIAAAGRGDTVIVAAGYNSTGPNGMAAEDVRQLQGWIQQLRDKGANVLIVGLRTENPRGSGGAAMPGTVNTNRQLKAIATATGARFSDESVRIANTIPENPRDHSNIHGKYPEIVNALVPNRRRSRARNGNEEAEEQGGAAPSSESGGGIREFFSGLWDLLKSIPIIGGFFSWLESLFTGRSPTPAATPASPTAPTGGRAATPQSTVQTPAVTQGAPLTSEYLDSLLQSPPAAPQVPAPVPPAQIPPQVQSEALAVTQGGRPLTAEDINLSLQLSPGDPVVRTVTALPRAR